MDAKKREKQTKPNTLHRRVKPLIITICTFLFIFDNFIILKKNFETEEEGPATNIIHKTQFHRTVDVWHFTLKDLLVLWMIHGQSTNLFHLFLIWNFARETKKKKKQKRTKIKCQIFNIDRRFTDDQFFQLSIRKATQNACIYQSWRVNFVYIEK